METGPIIVNSSHPSFFNGEIIVDYYYLQSYDHIPKPKLNQQLVLLKGANPPSLANFRTYSYGFHLGFSHDKSADIITAIHLGFGIVRTKLLENMHTHLNKSIPSVH